MSLADDIATTRTGEGVYALELSDRWSFRKPSGGVLASCALAAARAEIGRGSAGRDSESPAEPNNNDLDLLSATAQFIEPLDAGPLVAEVEVLRRGRSAAQVRVKMRGEGSLGLEALATFTRERESPGFDLLIAEPPAATPVADALDIAGDDHAGNWHVRTPFFRNFDTRLAIGTPFWLDGSGAGVNKEVGRWFRYKEPPLRDGHLDPLALPPIADTMPAALWQFTGPARKGPQAPAGPGDNRPDQPFYAPSLDLTVHFLEPAPVGWLLVKSYVRWAGRGYATGECEIWTETNKLVAVATQTMLIARRR